MKRIRKGDKVIVTTGKSKGHIDEVISVSDDKVIVKGANLLKKHVKATPQREGGIISMEGSLDISNVAHYNPSSKKADKVGFRFEEKDGKSIKVRFYKSNNELIDRI